MKIAVTAQLPAAAPVGLGTVWTQIGPAPLVISAEQIYMGTGPDSGEVVDIAIDPRGSTDQVIYLATNDGGIWKSTDGGKSWAPKTDLMNSLSMGAVVLDPQNSSIVYGGTGNSYDGGATFTRGIGILKSIDAGETWSVMGSAILTEQEINRILLPAHDVLLVATNRGLYRSVDGGINFGANAPHFDDGKPVMAGDCTDLQLDTATPTTAYLAIAGKGIFKSTDGGATFPTNLFSTLNATLKNYGFIAIAQSTRPDNRTLYASIQSQGMVYAGLFKSTDAGETWTLMPAAAARAAENDGGQLGYDQTVGVDPQDANRVYIGFQELYGSTDGGKTFAPAITSEKVHWDHHALVFSPRTHWGSAPTRVYVGTDGGLATSADGGQTWQNLNQGIATTLFEQIDIGRGSRENNKYTYGGSQDTGTVQQRPGYAQQEWRLGIDGDGRRVVVDPTNPLRAYAVDDGTYMMTDDGGDTWQFPASKDTGLPDNSGSAWGFPFGIDPSNHTIVYVVPGDEFYPGSQLYQSKDSGKTFTKIHSFPANIHSLAVARKDSNTLWVGLEDGTVQQSTNALAGSASMWKSFAPGVMHDMSADGIAIDPTNSSHVVVVYSGFSALNPANRTRHVFMTKDGGASWTDISGTDGGDPAQNLPDLPFHSVVIDPNTTPAKIIVASDSGVMQTADGGASWQLLGLGLPTVCCTSLALDASAAPPLLRVGTYGRSVYELTRPVGPRLMVIANLAFGRVVSGQSETLSARIFNAGSAPLTISKIIQSSGSPIFQVVSPISFPLTLPAGKEVDITIKFQPTRAGDSTATFTVDSNDATQPAYRLSASGTAV